MGNKIHTYYAAKPKQESEESNTKLYNELIAMGFNKTHALDAAHKFPDSFNEAIDWIQSKAAITKILNQKPTNKRIKNRVHTHYNDGYAAGNEDDDEDEDDEDRIPVHNNGHNAPHEKQINVESTPYSEAPNKSITTNNNQMTEVLETADIIIKGEYNMDASTESMRIISDMIHTVLSNEDEYFSSEMQPFLSWTNTVKEVKLNSFYYQDICSQLVISDKRVKNLYAFDKINQVFKKTEQITAYHTGWISLYYLELLLDVLCRIHALEYSKVNKIYLNDINNIGSLNEFEKYQAVFKAKNWNMEQDVCNIILSRC